MNFKFLKQALCLVICICVSNGIVQSMEDKEFNNSESGNSITQEKNLNVSEEKSIIQKIKEISYREEINKFDDIHRNRMYFGLEGLYKQTQA